MENKVIEVERKELKQFTNDRNILANTLTDCSDCPLRNKCQHTALIRNKYLELIKEEVEANKNRMDEHPGSNEHAKKLIQELDKRKTELNNMFVQDLVGMQCKFEKDDITENLVALQKKYDFNDPRVFLIVKSLIRDAVADFRVFKRSASEDIISYRYTDEGGRTPIINPAHMFRLSTSSKLLKTIEVLDKITKEDVLIDEIKTGNSRLFTDFISKL